MGRQSLPPGFRFHPTDIELVLYYLKRKLLGKPLTFKAIADVDLYKYAPWELPDKSCLQSRDQEWYFFCPRDRKYTSGPRTNRATETGYWKTTGRDRPVCQEELTVGMKKTLVFHTGRAPKGNRTNWVMHEYRLEDTNLSDAGISLDAYVLCKIFEKSGAGPKNGEQHGAPFKEEDWEEDVVENIVDKSLGPLLLSPPSPAVTANQNIVTENSPLDLPNKAASLIVPPQRDASSDVSVGNLSLPEDPDISTLLEYFQDADSLDDSRIANNKEPIVISNVEGPARMDGYDIFKDLEDIYPRAELQPVDTLHPSDMLQRYGLDPTLIGDDVNYLELNDLDCSVEDPMKAGGSMNREFESFGTRSELDSVDKLYPTDSPYRRASLSCVELNEFERGLLSYPAEAKESEKHASERNFDQYLSSDCFLPIAAFRSGSCLNPPEFSGVFENTTPLMFSDENIGKRSAVPCGYKGDQNPETAGLGKRPSSFAFTGGSFRPYKR